MDYKDIISKKNSYDKLEKFTILEILMKLLSKLYKLNKVIFEYALYANFVDYLKYICLKVYHENREIKEADPQIFRAFASLMDNLKMTEYIDFDNKVLKLKAEFVQSGESLEKEVKFSSYIRKLYKSYRFIIERQEETELFKTPTAKYIYYLIVYTRELEKINLGKKISPSFHESFYTDLGEVAFKLFNKPNYKKILPDLKVGNILDVGCGNGNFIDTYLEYNSSTIIYGVERQVQVCNKLNEKYQRILNVKIINEDVTQLKIQNKFDIANISYMLFYLSKEQQEDLLSSLHDLLSENGKITICQYFPNIEDIQMRIAINDRRWSKIDRYKFKISNAILYSEVLLNDGLSDFDHASRFDEFCEIINKAGLMIESIEKADNNYYSFYFVLSKSN